MNAIKCSYPGKKNVALKKQKGASLIEYVLLVALIAAVCVAAITTIGTKANTKLEAVGTSMDAGGK